MKKKIFIGYLSFFFLISSTSSLLAKINNTIIAKVGSEIITILDVENEIKILLIINNESITQENINKTKKIAIKSLVQRLIKKNEIIKYKIDQYSEKDLFNYQVNIAKSLNINQEDLIEIFKNNGLKYSDFLESKKTELRWNTLIFSLYKNQIGINPLEIENELNLKLNNKIETKKYKLSEIEIKNKGENNKSILENIYKIIKNESFESAVKKFSVSTSALDSGNIGWFDESTLSPVLKNELSKLKKGQVSKPVNNSESITILKIQDIKIIQNQNPDLEKLKAQIIQEKKQAKLNFFSRSHFSTVENTLLIKFL
ncbi:MAG: hypothetical protein CMI71_04375 [Candidatus Pelagibacter sp.]|nr:hypothetical protein [Candidatus Pelagibacter sp.]RPG11012.1 MAG: hypothetical protein CBD30_002255 [Pelagibacteraceae bacterium TMED170]|tara:strand:- start:957 stop:1898 length:942 start_codon:yes stop_codon:yes gene_type:complete